MKKYVSILCYLLILCGARPIRCFIRVLFLVFLAFISRHNVTAQIYTPGGSVSSVTNGTSNVGIGVSAPVNPLQVEGSVPELNILLKNTGTNGARTYLTAFADKSSIQTDKDFTIRTNYGYTWADKFIVTNFGNVGIGTVTPAHALSIYREDGADLSIITNQGTTQSSLWFRINAVGKDAGIVYRSDGRLSFNLDNSGGAYVETNEFLSILPSGNVGIGITTPSSKLDVNGGITVQSNNNIQWGGAYGPGIPTISGAVNSGLYFYPAGSTSGFSMRIHPSGNVGIGTAAPDAKLAVNGDIHTREVRVDLNGAMAPDYVFEKDYDLLPLHRLASYVAQHKHLPEVPSGREMEQSGLNLKEMNLMLLKKVEELTMYLINQNKTIVAQEERISVLEKSTKR